jgi:hypothetical protein|tara:strand:+ start:769 stop:1137 length:369 start_codon:yes stop_codon:yes gene_type:complete
MALPYMLKHRGFPGRLAGTDFQFTLRRANPKGATALVGRERFKDRKSADKRADIAFVRALLEQFGDEPFERGNLDAGRLSWLFGREVKAFQPDGFNIESYESILILDIDLIKVNFPEALEAD